jgi:tetratricopeptide (TPR) repeat protein
MNQADDQQPSFASSEEPEDASFRDGTQDQPRTLSVAELSKLSQQGYQFLRENMLREAEDKFRELLEYDPENNYALVGLGDTLRKRRNLDTAVEYYKRCLELYPNNNYALFGLADAYKGLKHYNRALEVWERYLEHDSENVTILTRVADSYRKVRNFKRSKELYERVLEIEADNAYALIGLGHLHYDFRDYENALHYWKRMYGISGDAVDIRVLTSIGNCHRKMKTFADGVFYFQKALDRQPNNFYALYGMADCYRGMGKPSLSLKYWNQILEENPGNKVILTRAGDAYRSLNQHETAERYYRAALNIEYDTYAVLGLAMINRDKGDLDKAIESLESLSRNEPGNIRLHVELARCYEEKGDTATALDIVTRVEKKHGKNRDLTRLAARLRGTRNG